MDTADKLTEISDWMTLPNVVCCAAFLASNITADKTLTALSKEEDEKTL